MLIQIYIVSLIFFTGIIIFFLYKLLEGDINSPKKSANGYTQLQKQKEKSIEIERSIESIKSSLKSLQLEESIGKVDKEDFHILQKEYIGQWKKLEESLKKDKEKQ